MLSIFFRGVVITNSIGINATGWETTFGIRFNLGLVCYNIYITH